MSKILSFNDFLLQEKIFDIQHEVDFLYDRFFKKFIDVYQKDGTIGTIPNRLSMSGDEFMKNVKNEDIKEANGINPLKMIIISTDKGNMYVPNKAGATLYISINGEAANLLNRYKNNVDFLSAMDQRFIKNELTSARVKGSIMHELSHWIRDSLNNQYLSKKLDKNNTVASSAEKLRNLNNGKNYGHQFLSPHELDAQVHAIVQFINSNPARWNRLTKLDDALFSMPFYKAISENLTPSEHAEWKKKILARLARENLMGKRMRR